MHTEGIAHPLLHIVQTMDVRIHVASEATRCTLGSGPEAQYS